jgi:hypothetical protein
LIQTAVCEAFLTTITPTHLRGKFNEELLWHFKFFFADETAGFLLTVLSEADYEKYISIVVEFVLLISLSLAENILSPYPPERSSDQ